jgi:GntR family transcriptional regulator/MocR family aminotransferase
MDESNLGSRFMPAAKTEGVTLTRWLCDEIRGAILSGKLKRGWALPATRQLAQTARVSRHIVVNVYEQLAAEGYLEGEIGRGTFVRSEMLEDHLVSAEQPEPVEAREIWAAGYDPPIRPFRIMQPAIDQFPLWAWKRAAARSLRRCSRESLSGGQVAGLLRLRSAIASYLASSRGVSCSAHNVVIVSGVLPAVHLIAGLLINPGDPVWFEDPGYTGAKYVFESFGARIVAVPVDQNGLNVERGHKLCQTPSAIYVTPAHQFGLGTALSLERRLALLSLARQRRTVLIEDDYDSEFRFAGRPLPAIKGMNGADEVFLLGTFNKLLFPALRLGYLVVPDSWMDRVLALRFRMDRYPATLPQEILASFIESGDFINHLRRMRQLYGERREILGREAARHLDAVLEIPAIDAGLYTPAYLLNGMSSTTASSLAATQGIDAWPIDRFTLKRRDLRALLLGFACFPETEIRRGVLSLARALKSSRQS